MFIDHINISAPKEILDKEMAFFCEVFNLELGFRPNFTSSGYWLYANDKALVHLTESDDHVASKHRHFLDHIAFQLTGLNKLLARLAALNVSYSMESLAQLGMTQVFFKSPAGIGLEANFVNESITQKVNL